MYRIVLACYDVPVTAGEKAADDITHEFGQHRKWHSNVICSWDGNRLILRADNDFDFNGLALIDEFSDCISAYIAELFDGEIKIESIIKLASQETPIK
jgi:hypothetical protein